MSRLVLLAGWGCDARIWQPLAGLWPDEIDVNSPDWPGYARRPALDDPTDLGNLARAMADDLPEDAIWVGWSLGGLLATALLDHLPAPSALVLLSVGPRFCLPEGISPRELDAFRRAFERAPDATRRHFLRWQLQGEPAPRAAYRRLLDLLGPEPCADRSTLAAGLAQLAGLDNRNLLAAPPCPLWRLAGAHDPLLAPTWRESADHSLENAGHCPMLGQPQALASCLAAVAARQ
jgi:pimeloyl-[acyl-carrier protein] methyl ester esterase